MRVREARSTDIRMIATMYRQLQEDAAYPSYGENLKQLEECLSNLMLVQGWKIYILEDGNQIVGYCLWQKREDAVYIQQFWITRSMRREGYGAKFIRLFKEQYWQNKKIKLEVRMENHRAIQFWESLGFKKHTLVLEWFD